MKAGFGRSDITPRVGVELCGFGPFRNRASVGVRDRLWARALAAESDGVRIVLVSCDLIGVSAAVTGRVRALVAERTGIPPEAVMVHGTHTHSGPATAEYIGWGEPDPPYLETLPQRIVRACEQAVERLEPVTVRYAETACEGLALNREYDRDAPPLDEVLREDWRPARPDLTDTTCHVFTFHAGSAFRGFLSSFGCHPVVCCAENRWIHGDWCGVATNLLERENPGSIGLFLQGAQGDINSCVVHKPERDSLLALDVVAARYANAVRRGFRNAQPAAIDRLAFASRSQPFTRKPWDRATLLDLKARCEAVVHARDATDSAPSTWKDDDVRLRTVHLLGLRRMIEKLDRGETLSPPVELQGLRLGPFRLLGTPFEVFRAIKNDVLAARPPTVLVLGLTNGSVGYAPDRTAAARGGYAADTVPLICASVPFANVHDELAAALIALDAALADG